MKKPFLFLLCFFLLLCSNSYSQNSGLPSTNPDSLDFNRPSLKMAEALGFLEQRLDPADTGEGGSHRKFAAFKTFWQARTVQNDSGRQQNMFVDYYRMLQKDLLAKKTGAACGSGTGFRGAWRCDGPDSAMEQRLGKIEDIWAHPTDTNKLLAATFGGLFRSADAGKNWRCITDNANFVKGVIAIKYIAVHPTDPNIIFLGTGNGPYFILSRIFGWEHFYGAGLLYTLNGGATWSQDVFMQGSTPNFMDSITAVQKVYFSPAGDRLYVLGKNRIFFKNFPSGSWSDITPVLPDSIYTWNEISFRPGHLGEFVLTSNGVVENKPTDLPAQMWVGNYNPLTGAHQFERVLFPTISFAGCGTISDGRFEQLAVSFPTQHSCYVAIRPKSKNHCEALLRMSVPARQWHLLKNSLPSSWSYHPAAGCFSIIVSPNDTTNIYHSNENAYLSVDGGQNFQTIGAYWGTPTHGDIRSMRLHHSGNDVNGAGDRLYYANDGGVALKPAGKNPLQFGANTLENINGKGLATGHQFGIGTSEHEGLVVSGGFHNGFFSLQPNDINNAWTFPDGGDALDARFSSRDPRAAFGESWWSADEGAEIRTSSPDMTSNRIVDTFTFKKAIIPPNEKQYALLPTRTAVVPRGSMLTGMTHLWEFNPDNGFYVRVSGSNQNRPPGFFDHNLPELTSVQKISTLTLHPQKDYPEGYVTYEGKSLWYSSAIFGEFKERTPPAPDDKLVTDLCMDLDATERAWVAIGGINWETDARNRVVYSPDAGIHWFDVSKGLPARIPVTKVVYQQGANQVYAATDVGIYRLDMSTFAYTNINDRNSAYNSVGWICFSTGASGQPDYPAIYTTDMEINYCSGRIYTSTYGRSVWSTPLWEPFKVPPITESNLITTNTTWTGTRYLTTGIRIKDGATLTITGTNTQIHLPKDGKIVVEAGAKLVVDGATLTNGCKDCLWGGIVAEGKAHLPQTAANQATVIVQNNALIENARNAITTWGGDISNAGAILNLSNSTFRNNKRSIEFISYHNTLAGRRIGNLSRISRCTFELNDDYRGTGIDYFFTTFISLWDVEGVVISGNSFVNTNTAEANFGNGITSFNAAYRVAAACNSPSNAYPCTAFTRNTFSGLKHGVFAEGDNFTDNTFVVDQAAFEKCGVGVLARTNNHFTVSRSNFDIGNAPFAYIAECEKAIGVRALSDCNGFRVEENTFTGLTAATPVLPIKIGVSLEHTGPDNKEVYKNYFKKLDYGALAAGVNGNRQRGYLGALLLPVIPSTTVSKT